jgi:tetratricopeptide (TPR) repeat protein
MDQVGPADFLDPDRLVESSRPVPRINLTWWMAGTCLLVILASALIGNESASSRAIVSFIWGLAILVLMTAMSALSLYTVKRYRTDQRRVEQVGELVQLRKWVDAALAVNEYLSRPARNQVFRVQALVYLSYVLARLHRFEESLRVQNQLIDESILDEPSTATLKISRAMSMLREDHLFDADRAISELRRSVAAGAAGVALVEIYRDVKTGHPQEAIDLFEQKRHVLRDQLGHRVADAYALIARAYDLQGRNSEAAAMFRNATLLAPADELFRRYPEVEKLKGKYDPSPAPPEAA